MRSYGFFFALLAAIMACIGFSQAKMQPSDVENTCNALASQTFTLKNLVNTIHSQNNPGPLEDVYEEFDGLFDTILADIELLGNTPIIQDPNSEQTVYEAYSNFIQAVFELTDDLSSAASVFIQLDPHNEYKIPYAIRIFSGVVDVSVLLSAVDCKTRRHLVNMNGSTQAYLFNMISLFPRGSAYDAQANNQKGQVDSHFDSAVSSYHLVTATTASPYSNSTAS
ncbi:hypothetical protein L228DRAFT_236931 [Xylona heveae TC161]|uniref:Uncharacterized protein n=1 Tax=Xylona heveae (strain CBS 132557 / TC161) TaxID=1328760 RepID=A0A165HUP1_XYLHT|nr:hypothetical protein L228DRAFT_236931 [Xylona heveae TC161]KZF23950.1 hypothetical protein L228DRAFT_236931 [Xylona heveae TC161]